MSSFVPGRIVVEAEDNNVIVMEPATNPLLEEPRVCDTCAGFFLDGKRYCARCYKIYCYHYASKIDTMYCQYCFHDFVMEDTILTKTIKSKSLRGNKIFERTMRARHIVFKGEAWMFAQRRVVEMTDDELLASIEYHREIYNEMLNEREVRSIKKNQLALKKLIRTSTDQHNPSGLGVGDIIGMKSATVKTTRVRKTTVVAQGGANPQLAIQAIVNMLVAQGMTQQQAMQAIAQMAVKK